MPISYLLRGQLLEKLIPSLNLGIFTARASDHCVERVMWAHGGGGRGRAAGNFLRVTRTYWPAACIFFQENENFGQDSWDSRISFHPSIINHAHSTADRMAEQTEERCNEKMDDMGGIRAPIPV